jgi:hypothetical protein
MAASDNASAILLANRISSLIDQEQTETHTWAVTKACYPNVKLRRLQEGPFTPENLIAHAQRFHQNVVRPEAITILL